MSFWTVDKVEQLRRLVAEGVPYGQIGNKLGCNRNAAIGKAHRLGLTEYRGNKPMTKPKRTRAMKPKSAPVEAKWHPKPERVKEPVLDVSLDDVEFKPLCVEYAALQSHHCRWPLDDGKICGHDRTEGHGFYCEHHYFKSLGPVAYRRARR